MSFTCSDETHVHLSAELAERCDAIVAKITAVAGTDDRYCTHGNEFGDDCEQCANPEPEDDQLTITFEFIERLASKLIPDAAVLLSPDYAAMAALLQFVRRAIAQLKWADEELTGELAKVLPGKETEIFGVGIATLRTGTTRKAWDKAGLVAAVTSRIADDPAVFVDAESGEFLPTYVVAERIIGAFLEVGTPSWKTGGLRTMSINPDEYCETVYGPKSVQLPVLPPFADRVVEGAGE